MNKLLIIEDDVTIRNALRILLENQGYFIEEAHDGEEGLQKFDSTFDLLIIDIMMPNISGIDVCRKIREKSYAPILFLTAKSLETDKMEALSAGGDDYLVKPFSYVELIARIQALIRRCRVYDNADASDTTSALGIEPEDIDGCPLGALGIPEFGTDFAMGMLLDTKPKEFSDLIRIAGLSHGTDVWLGNAQTLIEEGTATISTCICTRDDIMTYLISMGLESEEAFNIMEKVRKGIIAKGKCPQWPQWKEDMKAHGVPDWYIWSCEKIKYMFPKAHAAAYVMMAWRIAYCKVFYPLAYYAAYFSIRATGFSYELMCQGKDRLENYMKDYKKRKDTLSNKEQDVFKDMRIVQEMYARGFDFMPLDIYRAHPNRFQIIDGKLMPAINSIDGLGDNAAIYISEAAKDGPFLSKDDFRERTHVSRTAVDLMSDLGLLGSLPESNQLSLFDFGA